MRRAFLPLCAVLVWQVGACGAALSCFVLLTALEVWAMEHASAEAPLQVVSVGGGG